MRNIVRWTLNSTATALLVKEGSKVAKIAVYGKAQPSIVFRASTKTAKFGFDTPFAIVDGQAVIDVEQTAYLAGMTGLEPVAGTYLLKDITNGRYGLVTEAKEPKEGKLQLVNSEATVTVELLEQEDAPAAEEPAEIEG